VPPRLVVSDVTLDSEQDAPTHAASAARLLVHYAPSRVYGVMLGEPHEARTVLVLPGYGPSLAAALTAFLTSYGTEADDVVDDGIRPAMQRR
jgi:hypothetical protein